ncbi:MAG: hypothetical protein LBQ66_15690 [Planctomycetaceae bacterium]|jgi:hypothetical protein|nr:hypothetical protein [Planctomycetaceae bacterium]
MPMRLLPIRILVVLPIAGLFCFGCRVPYDNSKEFNRESHGTILRELPDLPEAKEPFVYPYAGDDDHRNCKFDDMMY